MRLQSKISLILLPLSIVPLLGLGWYAYDVLWVHSRERAVRELTVLLDQFVQHTHSEVANLEANINLFAKSVLLQKYVLTENEAVRYDLLQTPLINLFQSYIENYPQYAEIRVLLPDGFEDTRATRGRIPNATEEEADSEFFRLLASTEQDLIMRMLENPDNGRYVLYAGIPLKLTDMIEDPVLAIPRLRAYLVVTMDLERLVEEDHQRAEQVGHRVLRCHRDRDAADAEAGQQAAHHHRGRAGGNRLCAVARPADSAVGDDRHIGVGSGACLQASKSGTRINSVTRSPCICKGTTNPLSRTRLPFMLDVVALPRRSLIRRTWPRKDSK